MLTNFAPGLWLADGPAVTAIAGFHYPTRMALMRLGDGGLAVWSPVPLDAALRAEVDALGRVAAIIAPNDLHHLFIGDWRAAYPDAVIVAAPGVAAKRPDLTVDTEFADAPVPLLAGLSHRIVPGNAITTEVVLFHQESATVIFTDLLQQMPKDWYRGWRRLVARLDLMTGDAPQVPRKFRTGIKDRAATRAAIRDVLDWPAERVLMAHGAPVTEGAGAFLRGAFAWLKP